MKQDVKEESRKWDNATYKARAEKAERELAALNAVIVEQKGVIGKLRDQPGDLLALERERDEARAGIELYVETIHELEATITRVMALVPVAGYVSALELQAALEGVEAK